MSDLILTTKELADLTGYQKPCRQIVWLRTQGFTFKVAADGHPRVDRSHYLRLMGGFTESRQKKTEPNFDSLLNSTRVA